MIKKTLLIILIMLPIFLTACYDKEEIDNITYVIALGLDKGEKEKLKISMQYFTINEKSEGESANEETASITLEASSIIEGINLVNNSIDKKLSFSHTKLIVISEKLAKEGNLISILKPLENSKEFRPNVYMAVSKGDASKYLKAIESLKKSNIARYYKSIFSSYKYSGYYFMSPKDDFYYKMCDENVSAVVPYVAVNKSKKDIKKDVLIAGNMKEEGRETKIQIMGCAIFNKDKMVGVLTGKEATHFLMIIGEFNNAIYTIKDPLAKDKMINISLRAYKRPKIKIKTHNNKPRVNIDITLNGEYVYFESDVDYNKKNKNAILVNYLENNISQEIQKLLNKTSKEWESDICLFSKYARKNFLTWQEWEKYKWNEKYKTIQFDINVHMNIKMTGMIKQ